MTSNEHPFSVQLADLTTEELEKRYADLTNRWSMARRMGMDQGVLHQLDLLLLSVESEKERRRTVDDRAAGVILDTDPIPARAANTRKA